MKYITKLFVLVLLIAGVSACDFFDPERIDDPNNPSVEGVLDNASRAQLQNLVTGLEFRHRATTASNNILSTFGREIYPMFASDPRFVNQWIGAAGDDANAETNPSFFGSASTYTTPYRTILQGNVLIESANNTDAITDQQRNGYLGFAKTLQAYSYLIPLHRQYDQGIRFDVDDIDNLGPFLSYDEALSAIKGLLDDGLSDLNAAGSSFAFSLTSGFDEFDTPSTMANLNRAIAARVAIYQEDWSGAVAAAQAAAPFFEIAEGADVMNKGGYFVYGDPPDIFNPFYYVPNTTSTQLPMVHPSFVDDAESGDMRVENKVFVRDNALTLQGLSSQYQDGRFESTGSSFPFFRNEELVLIYAEAQAQQGNILESLNAVNAVRNTWGLGDFVTNSQSVLIDQILHERRYSLWFEGGHRWVDMRRYGRLDELPLDGGKIYSKIKTPQSEL